MPSTRFTRALLLAPLLLLAATLFLTFHPSATLLHRRITAAATAPTNEWGSDIAATAAAAAAPEQSELDALIAAHPTLIFSKSYCPYSKRAKHLLTHKYRLTPTPFVVELDEHPRGAALQDAVRARTGRGTVPNIMVAGTSLGGSDEVAALDAEGWLVARIWELAGGRVDKIHVLKE